MHIENSATFKLSSRQIMLAIQPHSVLPVDVSYRILYKGQVKLLKEVILYKFFVLVLKLYSNIKGL